MKIGRAAVVIGGLFALGGGIYFSGRILTNGWGGDLITINPPPGYTMETRTYGPQDVSWRLQKNGVCYTAKSELKVWPQSPLVPMTWGHDAKTLLGGYKSRAAQDKRKNPKGMTLSGNQEITLTGTRFVGFQTQEARPNAFVVIHYAAFEMRGRAYNGSAVFRFADKRPDPAKVKIADAEWKTILASVH